MITLNTRVQCDSGLLVEVLFTLPDTTPEVEAEFRGMFNSLNGYKLNTENISDEFLKAVHQNIYYSKSINRSEMFTAFHGSGITLLAHID